MKRMTKLADKLDKAIDIDDEGNVTTGKNLKVDGEIHQSSLVTKDNPTGKLVDKPLTIEYDSNSLQTSAKTDDYENYILQKRLYSLSGNKEKETIPRSSNYYGVTTFCGAAVDKNETSTQPVISLILRSRVNATGNLHRFPSNINLNTKFSNGRFYTGVTIQSTTGDWIMIRMKVGSTNGTIPNLSQQWRYSDVQWNMKNNQCPATGFISTGEAVLRARLLSDKIEIDHYDATAAHKLSTKSIPSSELTISVDTSVSM